jgi:uncharacterized membrane protein YphA (DoxX/SURF4 family)
MPDIDSMQFPLFAARALGALLLAITFLQSGLDNVFDQQGNLSYISSVFNKSPLKPASKTMFYVLMALEVVAGVLCALGFLQLLFANKARLAMYGVLTASITFVSLFFGLRMAKDYAGAAGLVPYFLLSVFLLTIMVGR